MRKLCGFKREDIGFIAASVILFAILALYLGYFPGVTFSNLEINYNVMGNVSGSIFYDESILYPYAARKSECFGLFLICHIFNLITKSSVWSVSLAYFLIFFVSYMSFLT